MQSSLQCARRMLSRATARQLLVAATLGIGLQAHAGFLAWDKDGNGSNGASAGTTGSTTTWNDSSSNWYPGTGTTDQTWDNSGVTDMVFPGLAIGGTGTAAGTLTVNYTGATNPLMPNSVFFTGTNATAAWNYVISGGTLNVQSGNFYMPSVSASPLGTAGNGAGTFQQVVSAIVNSSAAAGLNSTPANSVYIINNNTGNSNTSTTSGNTFLSFSGNNIFTGDLVLTSVAGGATPAAAGPTGNQSKNQLNIKAAGGLPSNVNVDFDRSYSYLYFTQSTETYTATFNNNMKFNRLNITPLDGAGNPTRFQSNIGVGTQTAKVTLTGVLSGNSDFNFVLGVNGGSGVLTLNPGGAANGHETYTGMTNMIQNLTSVLRIVGNDVLPAGSGSTPGTVLTFGSGGDATSNSFDLNGYNQTVAQLIQNNGTGAAAHTTAGIANNTGTDSTLTIDNRGATALNAPVAYGASIGTPQSTTNYDGTRSVHIALRLGATNTGALALWTNSSSVAGFTGSDYDRGTIIDGGTLYVDSKAASGKSPVGSGNVTINPGGTFGGTGGTVGSVITTAGTDSSFATLTPGDPNAYANLNANNRPNGGTATPQATLDIGGNLTLGDKTRLEFQLPSGTKDKIAVAGSLTVDPSGVEYIKITDNTGMTTLGTVYDLITYVGPLVNTFNFVIDPASAPLTEGLFYQLDNNTNAVSIELVPEPSTLATGLFAIALLTRRARRSTRRIVRV